MVRLPGPVALFAAAGLVCALSACDDGRFSAIPQPDAGPDAGPEPEPDPPPVFPLKEGDLVQVTVVGGRIEPCPQGEGFCDRAISADYEIQDVYLDEDTNLWNIDAHFFYQMTKADTSYESIQRLFFSDAAPLGDLTAAGQSDDGDATFSTEMAPTDSLTANGFPFFHFEPEYANQPHSAFQRAATKFATRILELDPEANIETQAANSTIKAYFKDELGTPTYLHKVEVKYHPMGFVVNWDEGMIAWSDGMQRSQGAFAGQDIPVAASWNAIRVTRDGERFNCSSFDLTCKNGAGECLDPADPEAEPSEAACE